MTHHVNKDKGLVFDFGARNTNGSGEGKFMASAIRADNRMRKGFMVKIEGNQSFTITIVILTQWLSKMAMVWLASGVRNTIVKN